MCFSLHIEFKCFTVNKSSGLLWQSFVIASLAIQFLEKLNASVEYPTYHCRRTNISYLYLSSAYLGVHRHSGRHRFPQWFIWWHISRDAIWIDSQPLNFPLERMPTHRISREFWQVAVIWRRACETKLYRTGVVSVARKLHLHDTMNLLSPQPNYVHIQVLSIFLFALSVSLMEFPNRNYWVELKWSKNLGKYFCAPLINRVRQFIEISHSENQRRRQQHLAANFAI